MNQSQWTMLIQDVADHFDDGTVKRGYSYYRQGRVIDIDISDPRQITGTVAGNEDYRTEINLDFFTLSYCSCPVQVNCKHQFALLLEFARLQDRSVETLLNAGQHLQAATASNRTANVHPFSAVRKQPAVNKQADMTRIKDEASRLSEMSVEQWHEWFAGCIAHLADKTRNEQYVKEALKSIDDLKPPLTPVLELLFRLNAHFHVLDALTKPVTGTPYQQNYYMGFFTNSAASQLSKAAMSLLESELPMREEPRQWERLTGTLSYVRNQLLINSRNENALMECYYLLLNRWIQPYRNDKELYDEELLLLRKAEDELGGSLRRYPWTILQCWSHFYLKQDGKALDMLGSIRRSEFDTNDLLLLLHQIREYEDWDRLIVWLAGSKEILGAQSGNFAFSYAHYWIEAVQHRPAAEPLMWETLAERLPYGSEAYEQLLASYGKWRQWLDYQICMGRDPLDFRVTEFAELEKNEPNLLLPFYHQSVERYVLHKNRDSYKNAVKLLKRLAKLYKKTKQEERWELFFSSFLARHSRLRALMEELRKGKLIP